MNTVTNIQVSPQSFSMCLRDAVAVFTRQLIHCLFDANYSSQYLPEVKHHFYSILQRIAVDHKDCYWLEFKSTFKTIRAQLDLDAQAALDRDPAAKSLDEIYLAYPGFYATVVYRLSHQLLKQEIRVLPRMMSEFAHSVTGTDIHPGAEIGAAFFIDHATGIVIGETTVIKDNVSIYQGVTLGGLQVKKSLASTKRHPTIESDVVIYANATILGGNVVIGKNAVIGANVCVTESINANSVVTLRQENTVFQKQ